MRARYSLLLAAGLLVFASQINAQVMMMMDGESEPLILAEAGVVLVEKDGKLIAELEIPGGDGASMAKGEELVYFEGDKIATVSEFKERYDALAIDDKFRIGVRGDSGPRILTLTKEPDNMAGGQTMRMELEGSEDAQPFIELGVLIGTESEKLKVLSELPIPGIKSELKTEDRIISIQGEKVSSPADVTSALEKVEVGETVAFVVERDGASLTLEFPKPAAQGKVMMRRQ